jgi:predicted DNA-binding transcriptional regulator YafY
LRKVAMSRAQRLLALIEELRRHRRPVRGAALAEALGISLRTLYRDIATLSAQGAPIAGEAGLGYVLQPGFLLPPLMFSEDELEALVLGAHWVGEHGDPPLAKAALAALAKIATVVPAHLKEEIDASGLLVAPGTPLATGEVEAVVRQAIRRERKLAIAYFDRKAEATRRVVWPFALGFFQKTRVVAAWCELRRDYRHFRTDRIAALELSDERYPRRRQTMLKEWRALEGIPS